MSRRLVAEFIGTAMLLSAVVGSGIMAERLAGGNVAVALLANTLATGAALFALILSFGAVSGAHFNPIVSLASALNRELAWKAAAFYSAAQFAGALAGVATANAMFDLPILFVSQRARTGVGPWLGEVVATFGLVGIIIATSRQHKPLPVALAVGGYIMAALWFTSSTSFANPAVTVARSLSDTFAGIRPVDVPEFIAAQVLGALAATFLFRWLVVKHD